MDADHHTTSDSCHTSHKKDVLLYSCLGIITAAILANLITVNINLKISKIDAFAHACIDILSSMWWGVALGIIIIGLMSHIPREYFTALMGRDNHISGLLRAVLGGVLLDLCCHGILLVAARLYERGVSLGQIMAFLIASPWNSLSLTLVLIGLIGLKWTLLYVAGSILIALTTGYIFMLLVRVGKLPKNPNTVKIDETYRLQEQTILLLKSIRLSKTGILKTLKTGWHDGKNIIKWLLLGTILAASLRTFVPHEIFAEWFGPTLLGLGLTVIVATIIEICSEGSAPLAGELATGAGAPGNAFAFLMAGVATDYTEMMVIREFTKSWKIALLLPAISVPQIILLGWIMNMAGL